MLIEVDFVEAKIMLNRLWPISYEFFDNIHGQIAFTGQEALHELKPRYFLWVEANNVVGTTHCYRSGFGRVRVRGTYLDEKVRGKGIGQKLVLGALSHFRDCHEAYTFPRTGTEKFYERIGFILRAPPGPSFDSMHGYSYAEKALTPRLFF